ncbi:hypothetical protein HPB49_013105 [Dermacentor silvarum]|uniref:Uncharacterized protein n=1 Tax=Dermacentor silvarum TaxID=543639 RepID=A0ACB8D5J1_DERSI|nr:hypothetical protein HPB49_013105 [Dermacentor silvarum]
MDTWPSTAVVSSGVRDAEDHMISKPARGARTFFVKTGVVAIQDPVVPKTVDFEGEKQTLTKSKLAGRINHITKQSRVPNLPQDEFTVIIRPRAGLNLNEHDGHKLNRNVCIAANIDWHRQNLETVVLNPKQNIIISSTPSVEIAKKIAALKALTIGAKFPEISAYQSAPQNTSKGVVKGIALEYTQKDLNDLILTDRNPRVVATERIGNTKNVIVFFSGLKDPRPVRFGAETRETIRQPVREHWRQSQEQNITEGPEGSLEDQNQILYEIEIKNQKSRAPSDEDPTRKKQRHCITG